MAPYDSDSSGDEEDYTETNVLLGYASKEPTDDPFSKLGGYPTWLDDKTAPSLALAKCKVCNDPMTLLLQLDANLPEHFPGHERRLYVFSCRRKTCRRKEGSVRGLRAVRVSKAAIEAERKKAAEREAAEAGAAAKKLAEEEKKKQPQMGLGDALFGISTAGAASSAANPFANPFSTSAAGSNNSSAPTNPFASASSLAAKPAQTPSTTSNNTPTASLSQTFAEKARIAAESDPAPAPAAAALPHEPWPAQSALPPAYPSYHLDADYETLSAEPLPIPQNTVIIDADADAGGSSASGAGGKEDKELFESALDKTFQRFADRLAQNPEQVLRYEFRGAPLLYSREDKVGKALASLQQGGSAKVRTGMPRCANCGADRVFECQLCPQAIAELEAEELGLEGMEWGTIVLGVCARDCGARDVEDDGVGYLEEWVGVQWEEVAEKRR